MFRMRSVQSRWASLLPTMTVGYRPKAMKTGRGHTGIFILFYYKVSPGEDRGFRLLLIDPVRKEAQRSKMEKHSLNGNNKTKPVIGAVPLTNFVSKTRIFPQVSSLQQLSGACSSCPTSIFHMSMAPGPGMGWHLPYISDTPVSPVFVARVPLPVEVGNYLTAIVSGSS